MNAKLGQQGHHHAARGNNDFRTLLDIGIRRFHELIENALAQLPDDLAVLMIEHDMDLVFRFAKRVVVLAAGAVIFDGSPRDVTEDAWVREAYLGSYAHASSAA